MSVRSPARPTSFLYKPPTLSYASKQQWAGSLWCHVPCSIVPKQTNTETQVTPNA